MPVRGNGWRLAVVLVVQAVLLTLATTYHWVGHNPWNPHHGLQQLDLVSLRQRVEGVGAVAGRPTMVAVAGDVSQPDCAEQVRLASRLRDRPGGLDPRYPLVVLLTDGPPPARTGLQIRLDPGGELASRLAFPGAGQRCDPGYALVDGDGQVRYRTHDPGWGSHGREQAILLAALGRDRQ